MVELGKRKERGKRMCSINTSKLKLLLLEIIVQIDYISLETISIDFLGGILSQILFG